MKGENMHIKVWLAISGLTIAIGLAFFIVAAPYSIFAFVPEPKMVVVMWGSIGTMAAGGCMLYEGVKYVIKHGLD